MVHREMVDCFRQIGDDSDCRAVVLTGAGKIFTAGWGKYYVRYMNLRMIRPLIQSWWYLKNTQAPCLPSKLILVLIETFVSDENVEYKIKHFTVIKVHF